MARTQCPGSRLPSRAPAAHRRSVRATPEPHRDVLPDCPHRSRVPANHPPSRYCQGALSPRPANRRSRQPARGRWDHPRYLSWQGNGGSDHLAAWRPPGCGWQARPRRADGRRVRGRSGFPHPPRLLGLGCEGHRRAVEGHPLQSLFRCLCRHLHPGRAIRASSSRWIRRRCSQHQARSSGGAGSNPADNHARGSMYLDDRPSHRPRGRECYAALRSSSLQQMQQAAPGQYPEGMQPTSRIPSELVNRPSELPRISCSRWWSRSLRRRSSCRPGASSCRR